jgi:hypothetical protein
MKTWKNRNRRSKKRKQRGGVRLTPEQKVEYTRIRDEVNRKLAQIPPEHDSVAAKYLKSTITTINEFLKPMFDAQTGIIKDDSYNLRDIDRRYAVYQVQEQVYNTEYGIVPAPAPAPAPAPPAPAPAAIGRPVYDLNAPAAVEGQPRTIADCNRLLADARARIDELGRKIGEDTARLEGVTAERRAEVDRLNGQIAASQAEVEAIKEAMAALRGEKGAIQAELIRIQTELERNVGKVRETSEVNDSLKQTIGQLNAGINLRDSNLETFRVELATLQKSSQTEITQKNAEIARIREEHRVERERINAAYQAQLVKLQEDMRKLEGEKAGTAAEKEGVQREKAALEAQIAGFRSRIAVLTKGLEDSQVARNKEAQEKAAAAEAARVAAEAAARQLDAATREGQELEARLRAAQGAKEAADRAAAEAVAARETAEGAQRGADARAAAAQREAEQARLAAETALADKGTSEREKEEAQRAAAAAAAAEAAAVAEAGAKAEEAAAAQQTAAAANGQRDLIQARLHVLENSVPTIVSITGANNDIVGGENGRQARYGEPLTVNWIKGVADRNTWVFVMFATVEGKTLPVYSQLVLDNNPFTFTSTVSGEVKAVVYDVASHSRGKREGEIDF